MKSSLSSACSNSVSHDSKSLYNRSHFSAKIRSAALTISSGGLAPVLSTVKWTWLRSCETFITPFALKTADFNAVSLEKLSCIFFVNSNLVAQ